MNVVHIKGLAQLEAGSVAASPPSDFYLLGDGVTGIVKLFIAAYTVVCAELFRGIRDIRGIIEDR